MDATSPTTAMDSVLRERFGLAQFRPGQREVIEAVLRGGDVLCVMPTGGGKSLCYQLPALARSGFTLVVSPLIALMKDQVDSLQSRQIRATFINSTLDPAEQLARVRSMEAGEYDLVYVAPERFQSGRFVEALQRTRPALLAVDEAHCISEWGHDFRPDYARLGRARRDLGMPPCIALTATATDLVRRDIADQLDLREPAVFVTGFDRPNLRYSVVDAHRDNRKLSALAEILDRCRGSVIVYASSRKRCEEVARFVETDCRRSAAIYHAGLEREARTLAQDRFMSGEVEVVVATNAFGMGVDKPDIRAVVHFNLPGTLEAYYQEAGRAGRDGKPAECVLLFAAGDRFLQELFIENEYPAPQAIRRIYDFLRNQTADPIELTLAEIREQSGTDLNESAVGTAVRLLESGGLLERFRPRENMAIVRIPAEPDAPSLVDRLPSQAHVQRVVLTAVEGLINRRFGEPIYFQPEVLSTALGIDRTALLRALRLLAGERLIDFIPPFRGNAIRMLDRERRGLDLGIDFPALAGRKNQEYSKLERMISYAQETRCRRSMLLGYFGDLEGAARSCGRCDNCGTTLEAEPEPAPHAIDTPAGREVLQKVLSGVARAGGRFGKHAIVRMLLGSSSERIRRSRLDQLSTFGILAADGFTQSELAALIEALTHAGLVTSEEADRFRPVVKLSDSGWAWLRGKDTRVPRLGLDPDLAEKVRRGGLPAHRAPTTDQADSTAARDQADGLREALRSRRTDWAREARVPPYVVFPDRVIDELVRNLPSTPAELIRINGIGPATMERYGEGILRTIRERSESQTSPADDHADGDSVSGPSPTETNGTAQFVGPVPTEHWTMRLLQRGFTVEEAAAIRGLPRGEVLHHATILATRGHDIPVSSFLDDTTHSAWNDWLATARTEPPPETPDGPTDAWPLFVAIRQAATRSGRAATRADVTPQKDESS